MKDGKSYNKNDFVKINNEIFSDKELNIKEFDFFKDGIAWKKTNNLKIQKVVELFNKKLSNEPYKIKFQIAQIALIRWTLFEEKLITLREIIEDLARKIKRLGKSFQFSTDKTGFSHQETWEQMDKNNVWTKQLE